MKDKNQIKQAKLNVNEIIKKLKRYSNPISREGMAKYGIQTEFALGVSLPNIRIISKEIGKNRKLAIQLWDTKIHEARMLASMIDEPEKVSEKQMEIWVKDFNSWDMCDQCCNNLFRKTKFANKKVLDWSKREEEFIKRAGFVLIACLAVHDKKANNEVFINFLPLVKRESNDSRNYVKKAVNWALRQIGKRNPEMNKIAIQTAREIKEMDSKTAKWIASDALRELESEKVQKSLKNKFIKMNP